MNSARTDLSTLKPLDFRWGNFRDWNSWQIVFNPRSCFTIRGANDISYLTFLASWCLLTNLTSGREKPSEQPFVGQLFREWTIFSIYPHGTYFVSFSGSKMQFQNLGSVKSQKQELVSDWVSLTYKGWQWLDLGPIKMKNWNIKKKNDTLSPSNLQLSLMNMLKAWNVILAFCTAIQQ